MAGTRSIASSAGGAALQEALLAAKRAAREALLSVVEPGSRSVARGISAAPEHNVVGVGIGRKHSRRPSRGTRKMAIRVYVAKKLPRELIPKQHLVPKAFGEVETDVVETGRLRPMVLLGQGRLRPARPGCSIGFADPTGQIVMAGTFGVLAQKAASELFVLSNNHVLANGNALPPGSPIFQPGLLDGGNPTTDAFARLATFVALDAGAPNVVDCALAAVDDPALVNSRILGTIGRLAGAVPIAPAVGMKVEKYGRTTGFTEGQITDVSADVKVDYDSLGTIVFEDQVVVEGNGGSSFSDAGDSGSVIVDRASGQAAALLFAGTPTHTLANKMSEVIAALGVSLYA